MGSLTPYNMSGAQRAFVVCGRELGQHCEHFIARYDGMNTDVISRVIGVPSTTSYMLTYDHLLNVVLPPLLPSQALVPVSAGIIARSTITIVASPLELIRTNLQSTPLSSDSPHTLRSVLTSVRALVRDQGVKYLWRGVGPTLWRDVPFSGIYWASYEGWKNAFARRGREGAWVAFVSGAVSGTSAALITSPFDVLKTRRQSLIISPSNSPISASIPLLVRIVRTEGASSLFTGILPRIAKIAPACGIMIASFEVCSMSFSYTSRILNACFVGSWEIPDKTQLIYT
jgi:solute carrier family 25 protein 39/40